MDIILFASIRPSDKKEEILRYDSDCLFQSMMSYKKHHIHMLTGSTIGFRLKEVQYKDSVIYPEYAAAAAFQRKNSNSTVSKTLLSA